MKNICERPLREMSGGGEPEPSEYAHLTELDWYFYQLATLHYDWQLDSGLVKDLEAMATHLYNTQQNRITKLEEIIKGLTRGRDYEV